MSTSSARRRPTQVRWAIGVIAVRRRMSTTSRAVRSLVEPAAPSVIDTNDGHNGARWCSVSLSSASASSLRGGKNSNEYVVPAARRAATVVGGAAGALGIPRRYGPGDEIPLSGSAAVEGGVGDRRRAGRPPSSSPSSTAEGDGRRDEEPGPPEE